jgi:hypothetical protein
VSVLAATSGVGFPCEKEGLALLVQTAAARTLVLADYPIGYASGFGETLFNLFQGFPDHRLWNAYPGHLEPGVGKARGQAVSFGSAQCPGWLPSALRSAYYPALKVQQALAQRRLFRQMAALAEREQIQALLTIPVTPWILGVSLKLKRTYPSLKLVVFVMDDWQGHHESHGLPFSRHRRALLSSAVGLATRRFAVSREMAQLYREEFNCHWDVVHNGLRSWAPLTSEKPARRPERIFLGGDVNVFRFDAVQSLAEGLERYNQRHQADLSLTIFGYISAECRGPLESLRAVNLAGRKDQKACLSEMGQADLLYLPLAFGERASRIALYSLPTKLPEYLSVGKPVLFHAPHESAIFRLAERYDLQPRLATRDTVEVDQFVKDWAGGRLNFDDLPHKATRALKAEFDPDVLSSRFQSAFAVN